MMASQSRRNRFSGFREVFPAATSADDMLRQFIQAPLEASRASALATGVALANFMSKLPDAFEASQQRELARIRETRGDTDPRVHALEASLEQTNVLRTMTRYGEARAQRALAMFGSRDVVFHGFVSDANLAPLPGLTVRLIGGGSALPKVSSATTEADGYFSIPLGPSSKRAAPIGSNLGTNNPPNTGTNPPTAGTDVEVEILRRGTVLHHDPVPLTLDGSPAYREYVISGAESSSGSDFQDFMAARSYEAPAAAGAARRPRKRSQKRKR
jgi:hypothetical protein